MDRKKSITTPQEKVQRAFQRVVSCGSPYRELVVDVVMPDMVAGCT